MEAVANSPESSSVKSGDNVHKYPTNTSNAVTPKANQSIARNSGLIGPAGDAAAMGGAGLVGSMVPPFFGLFTFIQLYESAHCINAFVAQTFQPLLSVVRGWLLFVQSNVATGQPLWLLWPEDGKYAARSGFFKANSEILPAGATISIVNPGLFWVESVSAITNSAIAGASHCHKPGRATVCRDSSTGRVGKLPNNSSLIRSEGWRGFQERNCVSISFHIFITFTFSRFNAHTRPNLLHSVAVPSRYRIRRNFQQLRNRLERQLLPDLQNNHLALFRRQRRHATHRRRFHGRFLRPAIKPCFRFQFTRQPPPQAATVIQRAVPERANTIVNRLLRLRFQAHQCHKRVLQHVFSFAMAQAQSAPIQQQLRCLRFIQPFAPVDRFFRQLPPNKHRSGQFLYDICLRPTRTV